MARFSERLGFNSLEKAIQRESMDDELRNRLWSALKVVVWDKWTYRPLYQKQLDQKISVERLITNIWINQFKLPADALRGYANEPGNRDYGSVRDRFFGLEWWQVYNFLEFILQNVPDSWADELAKQLNRFLEEENAAYRAINRELVEITDPQEIEAIELALVESPENAGKHLTRALELISDKREPDYRNSIKESISAVEVICQETIGDKKASLGECLKSLETHSPLHPAFREALNKLYGYTSDASGIRHSLADSKTEPSFADAKFMLVTSSAFVNYILTKAAEAQ